MPKVGMSEREWNIRAAIYLSLLAMVACLLVVWLPLYALNWAAVQMSLIKTNYMDIKEHFAGAVIWVALSLITSKAMRVVAGPMPRRRNSHE